jgi:hypothetical protein
MVHDAADAGATDASLIHASPGLRRGLGPVEPWPAWTAGRCHPVAVCWWPRA